MVEAFREGVGIYELTACKIHKLGPEAEALARTDKKKFKELYPAERTDGKTGELAWGYQGALNAYLNFDSSGRHSDERIIEMCKGWRKEHPMTVAMGEYQQGSHAMRYRARSVPSLRLQKRWLSACRRMADYDPA